MSLEGLDGLKARFRTRVLSDVATVQAWADRGCPEDADMVLMVHNLAGGAGTFGFAALHAAAAAIDDRLAIGQTPSPALMETLLSEMSQV